ncbi:hypothetical protein DID88_003231 [Monilinia fructigena]|uniref:WSC domain-containing protein n=1 Tax=Monilinia fructigena TaxID=38457 RepID=A0A395IX96_9HELO|nr:hypothetical protein DID88_003231 [Monilinia fructigena]
MGGNGFGFSMDYASTQKSTCSSCTVTKDLSNYWTPTLFYQAQNGSFIPVTQNGGVTVYYLQRSDPLDPEYANGLLAFPEGFRMVAGNPYLRSFNSSSLEQAAVTYVCLGTSNPQTNGFPNYKCPLGLRSQVFFPSCWDGVNMNSSTYVNHMAYPSLTDSGHCPASHPKRFVSIFYEILWNTPDFADMWYGNSQPFVWAMGDPTGYGFHGDFVNGWDVPTLQKAVDTCNDPNGVIENCPVFTLETDDFANALPGCNPVQSGPANAVQQTGCGATTTIGTPMWPYTDVTKTKGYAYIGCGFDTAGAARTLQGASLTNNTGMTIESCIDFCKSKGFSIAGLEYSTQCFCDNSILTGRAPVPGLVGNCAMTCSGNSAEICGGPALLSLYQKCSSTNNCTNIVYPFNSGLKKRKSEVRRERRQKRDAEGVCNSNSTSSSVTGSASSNSAYVSAFANSSASSISPILMPTMPNTSSLPLYSTANYSSVPAQTSSVSTMVPVATPASTKSTLNSSNSGTEFSTNPGSESSNSDTEVTTVVTTTTSTTLVIVTATALSPFDHSCNEDNCLCGHNIPPLQHSVPVG